MRSGKQKAEDRKQSPLGGTALPTMSKTSQKRTVCQGTQNSAFRFAAFWLLLSAFHPPPVFFLFHFVASTESVC